MMQSSFSGLHVALIMDGNGRWARQRGFPRTIGHREGSKSVRRVVEASPDLGIETLTLYAFSSDNWQRPAREVATLMALFRRFLRDERLRCVRHGVRVSVIGRRDRLADDLLAEVEATEDATRDAKTMHLRLAVDYSAQDAILSAAARHGSLDRPTREAFRYLLNHAIHSVPPAPDVDLLVRTGGEQRLSDFLLWECAYAELVFTDRMWPDFDGADLGAAVAEFRNRQRRFGGLPAMAHSSTN